MGDQVQVHTLVTGDFVENGYIIHREGRKDAVLIDPGAQEKRWLEELDKRRLEPALILATHAHLDHVGAIAGIQEAHDTPFLLHEAERPVLDNLDWQCDLFGLPRIPKPRLDGHLDPTGTLEDAGIRLQAIHTPGHTPGSTCYHLDEASRVFTGDTLFAGTVGRTDLPGGDSDQIVASLTDLCKRLDDETVVLPGHGPASTVGQERTTNPFFRVGRSAPGTGAHR